MKQLTMILAAFVILIPGTQGNNTFLEHTSKNVFVLDDDCEDLQEEVEEWKEKIDAINKPEKEGEKSALEKLKAEFEKAEKLAEEHINRILSVNGDKTVDHFHRELGKIMWQECAMSRTKQGLQKAISDIKALKDDFWNAVKVTGSSNEMNTELEKAYRLADFIELGILMCNDALQREESCGAHFREEYQTEEGEALRVDEDYSYVSAWAYNNSDFKLHKEPLEFEFVKPTVRSYK